MLLLFRLPADAAMRVDTLPPLMLMLMLDYVITLYATLLLLMLPCLYAADAVCQMLR